jgi:hypothetical protein
MDGASGGEVHTRFWRGALREDHLEDPKKDGTIIQKWVFNRLNWNTWIGLIWLRIGQVAGDCECGNEPSGSIKYREFID